MSGTATLIVQLEAAILGKISPGEAEISPRPASRQRCGSLITMRFQITALDCSWIDVENVKTHFKSRESGSRPGISHRNFISR